MLSKYNFALPGTKPLRGHQLHDALPRETERQTADTKAKGLNFPALVGYCLLGRLCMFLFLVAGLQLLFKPSGARVAVCV